MDEKYLNGMCRIYSCVDQVYNEDGGKVTKKVFTVFYGEFKESKRVGDGIQVKSYISEDEYS